MARWALFLTDSMTAAIDLLLRTETAGFDCTASSSTTFMTPKLSEHQSMSRN
jgi:hypothetical protein